MKQNKEYFRGRHDCKDNELPEQILCAAIWYKEVGTPHHNVVNVDKGSVVCAHRHGHVIALMMNLTGLRTVTYAKDGVGEHIQGFLTNKNRFVDRQEAAKIAMAQGQCIDIGTDDLYSEDLY